MVKNRIAKNFGMIFILACLVISGLVVSIIYPDSDNSETENRPLQSFPVFNMDSFKSGDFQDDFLTYSSDQFPNRSRWMRFKTQIDLSLGIKQVQDVYIGQDNYLIQMQQSSKKDKDGSKRIKAINEFYKKHSNLKTTTILVPNKISMYQDKLPTNANAGNQDKLYDKFQKEVDPNINKIDTRAILKQHTKEELYYHTDHHWTSKAAKYVADSYTNDTKTTYDVKVSNEHFVGTLANTVGYTPCKDKIELYIPNNTKTQYVVDYVKDKKKTATVYDKSKQLSNDPYAVFLGGNYPLINIETNNMNNKNLLIFKDSYANCFIPFILNNYNHITIVDPRYCYDDIETIIKDNAITDVTYLYNMNTFYSDDSLLDMIG